MRKLVLTLSVLLFGCASEEQLRMRQEQEQARSEAVLAYLVALCEKQGVSREDIPAMRGCLLTYISRAEAGSSARLGNALQGMGSVLSTPMPRQQQCSTRPDLAGGWTTTCY
jgi:hypothetical protein